MNKILVLVYIPEIEQEYDVYIPINKKIGTIKKYLISSVEEFNDGNVSNIENFKIYDKDNSKILYQFRRDSEFSCLNACAPFLPAGP